MSECVWGVFAYADKYLHWGVGFVFVVALSIFGFCITTCDVCAAISPL